MNVGLGWLGVVVGAIGSLVTYFLVRGSSLQGTEADTASRRRTTRLCAGATLIVTLILWAVAMQTRVPFSPGQGLAYGLLIGGVTGAASIIRCFILSQLASSVRKSRLCTLSNLFFGLFAVSLVYSVFASNPWEPLIGFSVGATMAAIFHTYMNYIADGELPIATETWAVFSITIAAAILLAMRHFDVVQDRAWWALPILLGTTVLIAAYIATELASIGSIRDNAGRSYLASMFISAALVAGLTAIYSWKLFNTWALLEVAVVGIGVAALIVWLFAGFRRDDNSAGAIEAGAATVLLLVAFAVVTFKLWSGLGIALGLIAAWTVAIPALTAPPGADDRAKLLADAAGWPLAVGLVILLFRLFVQEYHTTLPGSDLEIHYTFIGAMLGAILPFIFVANVVRLRQARVGTAGIAGVAMMGLIAAASPLVLALLWGDRSALGFSFGLTAAMAFMLLARLAYGDAKYSIAPLVVGAQLMAVQFTGQLVGAEVTRAVRIIVLAAIVVLCITWFGLTSVFAARRAR